MARRIKKRNIDSKIYLRIIGVSLALTKFDETFLLLQTARLSAKSKFCFNMIRSFRLRLSLYDFEILAIDCKGQVLGKILHGDLEPHGLGMSMLLDSFENPGEIAVVLSSPDRSEVRKYVHCEVDMLDVDYLSKIRKVAPAEDDNIKIAGCGDSLNVDLFEDEENLALLYKKAI